jgi:adhesin/invasin
VSALWSWSPEAIYADGFSTATLTMTLLDVNGSPIAGKEASFTASAGAVDASAVANEEGELSVIFTAPETAGEVIITVTTPHTSFEVPLQVVPLPEVFTVVLEASDAEVFANYSGGQVGTSTLTATCYDADGAPVPAGIDVTFEIASGPGGGEQFLHDQGNSITVITDAAGQAHAILQAGDSPGPIEIVARSGTSEMSVIVTVLTAVREIDFVAIPPELWVVGVGKLDHATLEATCRLGNETLAPGGVPVTFTLDTGPGGGETLLEGEGGVDRLVAFTNGYGVARATLRSGTISGPLEVTAAAGDASETLRLGISSGPPTGMYCEADMSEDDEDEWDISATVHDIHHNPVPDGTIVVFTADHGMIVTDGGTGSAPTIGGVAVARFISFASSGVARIQCTTDEDVVCNVEIDLSPFTEEPGPIAHIQLTLGIPEIAVRGTGGLEACPVNATCFDIDNQPVGRDREVTFRITAGPGGGEELVGAGWGPVTAFTNNASRAMVAIASGTISGTVRVEVSADSALSTQAALVNITAGPPALISVGISPLNIRGWDMVGATADVWAYVYDIHNNPVRDNTVVWFTCDEGMIRGDYIVQGDLATTRVLGGIAYGTYYSGLPREDGIVLVDVSTAGGTVVGTGGLISSGPPYTVEFVSPADSVAVTADGESGLNFWVEVLDINQNFVVGGTEVNFDTDLGSVTLGAQTADGIAGSLAEGDFTSEVLDLDFSVATPDDGIGGYAHVTADAGLGGAASDMLIIKLTTTSAYRQNCDIDGEASVSRGSSLPFDVTIKDRYGNPLGGHVLSVSTAPAGPLLSPANPVTDMWGTVSMMLTPTPADSGSVTIVVDDTDGLRGGIRITKAITVN